MGYQTGKCSLCSVTIINYLTVTNCNTIFQLDEYNELIPGEIVDLMEVSTNNCDYYETDEFIEWNKNVSTLGNYFITLFMNIKA